MEHEIIHRGLNELVLVRLSKGEWLKAEAGALVAKSDSIHIEGTTDGGAVKALKRSLLGGERFFFQTLRAIAGGEVLIAPAAPGEIIAVTLQKDEPLHLEGGSFLAALNEVNLDTRVQSNSKALLTGTGLFSLQATGTGTVLFSAFGGAHELHIPADEEYLVDSGHIIAWSAPTLYTVEKASATWLASATSGELTICRFKGPAHIYLQTRNPYAFGQWLRRYVVSG